VVTFAPDEAQGPGVYALTTVVTDNGTPNLSATNTITVTVDEVNSAPVLTVPDTQTIGESNLLSVYASATDSDLPANTLTFSLILPPTGMSISPTTGLIQWVPSEAQAPSTNLITVVVTDDGQPPLSATKSFTVVVTRADIAPPPTITSVSVSDGVALLNFTSVSNHVYRLQFKSELTDTNWTDVLPDITATNSTATCTNACGAADQRFYRLQVVH
jgi:hypothetical protein